MPMQDTDADRILLNEVLDELGPVAVMTALRDSDDTIVDFRYEYVNPAFCTALGETAEALVGQQLLELYPSHRELGLFDAYCDVVETGVPYVSELPWFDERNAQAYFEVRVTPFRDGYLLTGQDVTARHLAEQAGRMLDRVDVDLRRSDRDEDRDCDQVAAADSAADRAAQRPAGEPNALPPLEADAEVEVWVPTTSRWVPGFQVECQLDDGSVLVRRSTDDHALPQPFRRERVRPKRRRSSSHGW